MEFPIADTFADRLARLTGDEQQAVKTIRAVAVMACDDEAIPLQ